MIVALIVVAGLGTIRLAAISVLTRRRRGRPAAIAGPSRALIAARHAPAWAIEAGYVSAVPLHDDQLRIDPTGDVLQHVAPGPGSLTTLAQVGEGSLITITHEDLVDPEVAQWFVDAFDRPAHVPACDEAGLLDEGGVLTRFHIGIEGAMRTARLWQLRGHADHGPTASRWADLDRWRIDTPTGEYPVVALEFAS